MTTLDSSFAVRAPRYGATSDDFRSLKVSAIVLLHALVLFALMHDKVQARMERVIKAEIITLNLSEPSEPVRVNPARTTTVPKEANRQAAPAAATPHVPAQAPAPMAELLPVNVVETVASASRDSGAVATQTSNVVPAATQSPTNAKDESPRPPPAPPRVELPSSNADYLNNPAPPYPAQSKRLGEQGKVLVHVFVSVTGTPEKVELRQSSGFDRLDQIALDTVKKWRFVPGKRNGSPEAMWVNVPLVFELT